MLLANLMAAGMLLGSNCQTHEKSTLVTPAQAGTLSGFVGKGKGTRLSAWSIRRSDCDPQASEWIAAGVGLIGDDGPWTNVGIGIDASNAQSISVWVDEKFTDQYQILSTDGDCIRLSFVSPLQSGATIWLLIKRIAP